MYSEYTIYTLHTEYATYVFPIYSLYIAHTDSQLYFDKYKICVQNKCALCTLYTSLYVQHTHCDCVFTLAGPAHLARISKIMTRQKKRDVNAVNNDNVIMPLS